MIWSAAAAADSHRELRKEGKEGKGVLGTWYLVVGSW